MTTGGRAAVIVLGGGSGQRVGAAINKVYLPLAGRRVVSWSLTWASQLPEVGVLVLVVRPQDVELARAVLRSEAADYRIELVLGGDSRHGSEQAALAHLAPRIATGAVDLVAIHDGARPLAGPGLFASVLHTAAAAGGAVPVLPAGLLLPVDLNGEPVTGEPAAITARPGTSLTRVQTPQAFRARDLLAAYTAAATDGHQGTDTSATVQQYCDLVVRAVPGSHRNLKVTYPHDLALAERILAAQGHRLT